MLNVGLKVLTHRGEDVNQNIGISDMSAVTDTFRATEHFTTRHEDQTEIRTLLSEINEAIETLRRYVQTKAEPTNITKFL